MGSPGGPGGARGKGQGTGGGDEEEEEQQQQDLELDEDDGDDMDDDYQTVGACWMSADREAKIWAWRMSGQLSILAKQ